MDKDPVRINIRIPADINDYLDTESKRTGVPKSSLVYMMIDKYISDKKAIDNIGGIPVMFNQLANIEESQKNNK